MILATLGLEGVNVMSLTGKVALVTGGARGIGREIALTLARNGAKVAIVDIDQDSGQETEAELEELTAGFFIYCDIVNVTHITQAVHLAKGKFDTIDILINNAGISIRATLDEMTEEQWDRITDINLKGAFFFSQEVAKIMMAQKYGKIVNIGSIRGYQADLTHSGYSATKAGIHSLTRSCAVRLAPYNINVNSVSPGYVITPMTAHNLAKGAWLDTLIKRVPLGRPIEMEEIAAAVLFLVSGQASAIMGHDLVVDGGWTINAGL